MTKVNYLKFMENAKKVAKTVKGRPILKGVEHREDGTLTVTDSHRLYRAYNVNAPKNTIIHAETGEVLDLGNYPNTDNLITSDEPIATIDFSDLKAIIKKLKAIQSVGVANGLKKDSTIVTIENGVISLDTENPDDIQASISYTSTNEMKIYLSLQYFIEIFEFFESMNCDQLTLQYYSPYKPLKFISKHNDNLVAILLGVRKA